MKIRGFILSALLLPVLFISCDRTERINLDLSNTIWAASGDAGAPSDYRQVLNFYDGSHVAYYTFQASYGGSISQIPSTCWKGTYSVVSNSEVSFNLIRSYNIGGFSFSFVYENGLISGNDMVV